MADHPLKFLSGTIFPFLIQVLVCTLAAVVAVGNLQGYLLLFVGFLLAVWVACRFPLFTTLGMLVAGLLPSFFKTIPINGQPFIAVGGGFQVADIILLSMLAAVSLEFIGQRGPIKPVYKAFMVFGLWLFIEVIRNIDTYGLSAPGEFRFRYLILVVPVYVALFFDTPNSRRDLVKYLALLALIVPLALVPVIGQMKGWSFGVESRFMASELHLGLLYGLLLVILSRRYRLIRIPPILLMVISIVVLSLVIADSHRSVWLAGAIMCFVLFLLKELRLPPARLLVPAGIVASLGFFWLSDVGSVVYDYVVTRGIAFIDYNQDLTASWRVAVWVAAFDLIIESPFVGEGFGGYWYFPLPEFGRVSTVSPHSLYIQSLVKIGFVGLVFYGIVMFFMWRDFRGYLSERINRHDPEYALVLVAMVALIASHVFYTVYSFEYVTMIILGIGMAKAHSWKEKR